MTDLIRRTTTVLLVIFISFLFFYPNIAEQKLEVVFKNYYRTASGQKVDVTNGMIDRFLKSPDAGMKHYFDVPCVPEASDKFPASRRCVITTKFITTARVNELAQDHPELIDDYYTRVMPHPVEKFFSFLKDNASFKNLQIKLGLDLQGGMRATFRADFDSYLGRLNEKYQPVLKELNEKIQRPSTPAQEKESAEARIRKIQSLLTLDEARKEELLFDAKRIIDKRLAAQNLTEPEVRIQLASYSIGVDMPGAANSSDVLNKIKDTVTVEYRIVNKKATDRLNGTFQNEIIQIRDLYRKERIDPVEIERILDDVKKRAALSESDGRIFLLWRRGRNKNSAVLPREFRVLGPVVLDGNDMTDARGNPNPTSGWFDINFQLSGPGAEKFGDITTKNVGNALAILWGDRVVSDPTINTPIVGGNGVITGTFSREEADEIANVIREGALPLPLEILSVNFVGPGLGQESIVAGVNSILIGFLLVILFMIAYYRLTGMIAVIALFLNLLIMAAILSLLEFTLTLPGFAGIILTVGMAVDANVIIFEKMREDLRSGRSLSVSISNGFESSFWTILDANVTSLIAAVILFYNGDGPIKGFAITLFFGLLSSMFTALYVSRLIFDWMLHLGITNLKPGWNVGRK